MLNSYLEMYGVTGTTDLEPGKTDDVLEKALSAYSSDRQADLKAICQLALDN